MVTKNVIVFALASQIQKIIGLRIVRQFQIKSVSSTVAHCQLPNQIIPEQRWLQSTIVKNEKNAKGLRMIEVEVNDAVSSQYLNPGQYVKLKRENAIPSFFALASPPDNRKILSFLIKEGPSNNFIVESKEGDNIDVSMPHGQGFQIKEHFQKHRNCFPVNRILLMACGSGIAPIAAAIESDQLGLCNISQRNSSREVLLYIGARTPLHLPFADRYASWEAKGVNVIPVISRPSDKLSIGWHGRIGYIQDALRSDNIQIASNTAALLCGMKGMTDDVKELLLSAGVTKDRILLNL